MKPNVKMNLKVPT